MTIKQKSLISILLVFISVFIFQYFQLSTPLSPPKPNLNKYPLYSHYQFNTDSQVINIGVQPLGVPIGAISELIKRDKVLRTKLNQLGFKLSFYNFLNGSDLNHFWQKGIDIGLSGDMPTLVAATNYDIVIASLLKQEFTSLVAREYKLLSELKNKRIAVPFGSNAHYSILRALKLDNMSSSDVELVDLSVQKHAQALQQRKIDAFAVWEPFPTLARRTYPEQVIIHKGLSTAYLFFSRQLVNSNPEVARLVLAAQLRAMRWMNLSRKNLYQVSTWQLNAYEALMQKKSILSVKENAKLIRNGLLSITDTPVIPSASLITKGYLHQAFLFLQEMKMININASWQHTYKSFQPELLEAVLADKRYYQLDQFDYRRTRNE